MRKEIIRNSVCSNCKHHRTEHKDDGTYLVECLKEDCSCEEFDNDRFDEE